MARVQDPLTLSICLGLILEPGARGLIKKKRELFIALAREWNVRLMTDDREYTLARLAQCVMKVVTGRDLAEVIGWARDSRLPLDARFFYTLGLQRFARRPGIARDAVLELLHDRDVGGAAVVALAGALKSDALGVLRDLKQSSLHAPVREPASASIKKIEARTLWRPLPVAHPSALPDGYASASLELDTDQFPRLLEMIEREGNGNFSTGAAEGLTLSANQLKRGKSRFHIVSFVMSAGATTQVGLGLYAEDDDVVLVEIRFGSDLNDAVRRAVASVLE
jgi:hypothetical protein